MSKDVEMIEAEAVMNGMEKERGNWLPTVMTLLAAGLSAYYFLLISGSGRNSEDDSRFDEFFQVFDMIRDDHYFFDGDEEALILGATEGLIAAVGDSYTNFFSLSDFENAMSHLGESFYGIGAEVTTINDETVIVAPFPDSPAENYGIMAGDVVVSIDGDDVRELSLNETINKIRGPLDSVVNIGVTREGVSGVVYVDVTRGQIMQETVRTQIFEENGNIIGYLQVTTFGEATFRDFVAGIAYLEDADIDSLVVDVRNNSGGYLNAVNQMVDYLLPGGKTITSVVDRTGNEHSHLTSERQPGKDFEIVTLINGGSASASEIFAAAMIESGGFEVVGTNSFGKGTVQESRRIGSDKMLQMTVREWLTPDGNTINEVGVAPTIEVEPPVFYTFPQVHLGGLDRLEYDMVHVAVLNAQNILDIIGYNVDRTDGYFDESTVQAVRTFQQNNDLEVTGHIDGQTASRLTMALRDKIRNSDYDTQLLAAIELLS